MNSPIIFDTSDGQELRINMIGPWLKNNFKIKDAGKWTKVVVYYDMGQVVNAISSKKANANLEVSDTDDDAAILKDCYVAILSQNKGGVVEISDVTLKKK
jgi:hypothetical protein